MNCEKMESLLLAVVDGRATSEEQERVAAHAAACPSCAQRMEEMSAIWAGLDSLPSVEPSPWFDARLRARMSEPLPKTPWFVRLPSGARWAAVAALVAVALWVSLRPAMRRPAPAVTAPTQQDFAVIKNLPELENYDVISNFEALSALPGAQTVSGDQQQME
jgi:anti-sigma factor RsiW